MGTSGGGAGGGSGGSGGGGGIVRVARGGLEEVDPKEIKALASIQKIFTRLSQDYIQFMTGDVGVGAAYEALHTLHVMLVQNRSWEKVKERFGVPGGKGCLRALIEALSREDGSTPVHPRVRAPLQAALQSFFLRVVGGDPVIRDGGNAEEVLAALKPGPFQSTSSHFLGAYLYESLRLEEAGTTSLGRERLKKFSAAKANQVVASFEARFKGKAWNDINQVGFTHLFRVLQGEPKWLAEQLRKTL